jgi:hypothetical protein
MCKSSSFATAIAATHETAEQSKILRRTDPEKGQHSQTKGTISAKKGIVRTSTNECPSLSKAARNTGGSITDQTNAKAARDKKYTAGASNHDFLETKRFISNSANHQ